MKWLIWAVVLMTQNLSFTLVSRARNSGSIGWHAVAAVGSNGVWIISQFILIEGIVQAMKSSTLWPALTLGAFYTTFTVLGSVIGHYVSMRWIEKGRRRVGA